MGNGIEFNIPKPIEKEYSGVWKTISDLIHIANRHSGTKRNELDSEILWLSEGLQDCNELIHLTVEQAELFGIKK